MNSASEGGFHFLGSRQATLSGFYEQVRRDTLCDTLVLRLVCAYKDLGRHRGLVSCCNAKSCWIHTMKVAVL